MKTLSCANTLQVREEFHFISSLQEGCHLLSGLVAQGVTQFCEWGALFTVRRAPLDPFSSFNIE